MRLLPSPVQTVRIPAELSVTALTGARPCLLAPVASDGLPVPLLRLGPQAELGSLLHKLVEDAGRGRIVPVGDAEAAVRAHFDVLLRECQQELRGNAFSKAYSDLNRSFSFLEWHSRTEIAIAEAVRTLDRYRPWKFASESKDDPSPRSTDLNVFLSRAGEVTLFEVPFHSRKLRLKGRIDELSKLASGAIEVVDYKTGRIGKTALAS